MINDIICAIATPIGKGAISIIRVSGKGTISLINTLFKNKDLTTVPSHTVHYGYLYDGDDYIDEVMAIVMKSPKTFTTEDTVEINCHGGILITNKVLETIIKHGARMAEPGEFSKRAYLNGRIDLAQSEAIMDIIDAKSNLALQVANQGLDGRVSTLISNLKDQLLQIVAQIEVNIDYPEYDDVQVLSNTVLRPLIVDLIAKIKEILITSKTGKIIREGINTAIVGRPNVGKSSILNALLREDKAIVTNIEGTTRDIVEGQLNVGGLILNLIDTAGIRSTKDVVEQIGIAKAKSVINKAELVLVILNNNEPLTKDDLELLEITEDKNRIVIINKIDLDSNIDYHVEHPIYLSALNKQGILDLEKRIKELFFQGKIDTNEFTFIANVRHISKLHDATFSLQDALLAIDNELPIDMVEMDIKNAWYSLGDILGDNSTDSLLDELFSKFCLGK